MIRFGVPPIGGDGWFGGWMFMHNLVRALALHGDERIETVVFIGPDKADDPLMEQLRRFPRTQVVIESAFEGQSLRSGTLGTLLGGRRRHLIDVFTREKIDVALDWATYYGWRNPIPTIAWIPDFQHRFLPHLFGKLAWWKRELGFKAQVAASEAIYLSSFSAQDDCLAFYPSAKGKTKVARFAVPADGWPSAASAIATLEELALPRDFVFLPNQLWQHKNHRLAIEAAGILAQRGSRRCVVATGRGNDPRKPNLRTELEEFIITCGAQDNFILLDGVTHDQVKALMLASNALLNPSRFEGWSTTVEEAKAIGTPMLLSDLAVHREQAPDAAFFGPDDADALCQTIADTSVRSAPQINAAKAEAKAANAKREHQFAAALSQMIKDAHLTNSDQIAA